MFGMGFTEIMIIAVIAILFLGPDKLPSAMVEIAKFFRNAKNTIGSMKESLEEEMNVREIKDEALAYKQELLNAGQQIKSATDVKEMAAKLTSLEDESFYNDDTSDDYGSKPEPVQNKPEPVQSKPEEVTLKKKKKSDKLEEDNTNV